MRTQIFIRHCKGWIVLEVLAGGWLELFEIVIIFMEFMNLGSKCVGYYWSFNKFDSKNLCGKKLEKFVSKLSKFSEIIHDER